jgi:hypothetical protein
MRGETGRAVLAIHAVRTLSGWAWHCGKKLLMAHFNLFVSGEFSGNRRGLELQSDSVGLAKGLNPLLKGQNWLPRAHSSSIHLSCRQVYCEFLAKQWRARLGLRQYVS